VGRRTIAAAAVLALLFFAAPAVAGAPNYDCVVGDGARLSIDQWSGIVAATGFESGQVVWGPAEKIVQAGPSLDLVAQLHGEAWIVELRGYGKSLVVKRPDGALSGHCLFIPGNYILRASDAGGFALRAGASALARRLLRIPVGAAVWQTPNRELRGAWFPITALVAHAGKLSVHGGWLRQRKPLVTRPGYD
jgi:hypothetical protein